MQPTNSQNEPVLNIKAELLQYIKDKRLIVEQPNLFSSLNSIKEALYDKFYENEHIMPKVPEITPNTNNPSTWNRQFTQQLEDETKESTKLQFEYIAFKKYSLKGGPLIYTQKVKHAMNLNFDHQHIQHFIASSANCTSWNQFMWQRNATYPYESEEKVAMMLALLSHEINGFPKQNSASYTYQVTNMYSFAYNMYEFFSK